MQCRKHIHSPLGRERPKPPKHHNSWILKNIMGERRPATCKKPKRQRDNYKRQYCIRVQNPGTFIPARLKQDGKVPFRICHGNNVTDAEGFHPESRPSPSLTLSSCDFCSWILFQPDFNQRWRPPSAGFVQKRTRSFFIKKSFPATIVPAVFQRCCIVAAPAQPQPQSKWKGKGPGRAQVDSFSFW